ncbi:MAG TPA: hypothetical protein VFT09_04405 [Ilumatobacteraceae bacterium]|nr:hypothetical protein [Ilumatobacteraceae bacterium]
MRAARGTVWRAAGLMAVATAGVVAIAVHRCFPWIPPLYLAALIAVPGAAVRVTRWRSAPRLVRPVTVVLAAVLTVGLCPVPWLQAELDEPPGSAWQLDGRLVIDGASVDPPGTWYWLTVGRPPIVAELVAAWVRRDDEAPTSLRGGRLAQQPVVNEPAAAAVGLRRAGWAIELGVVVEVSDPLDASLPARAVLAAVNGLPLTDRAAWERALGSLHPANTLVTAGGQTIEFGEALPFGRVDVIDVPTGGLDAAVGGRLARTLPGSWFRHLSVGASHGLMVALVSYVYGSGQDLAAGRTIAGTGTIRGDGTVGRIKGLRAKATAAREIGADVLLFPARQVDELAGFDAGPMHLVPVDSLDEAIAALAAA